MYLNVERFQPKPHIRAYVTQKNKKMEKFKSFAGQFLLVGGACLVALYAYERLNKPVIAAPAAVKTVEEVTT